MPDTKGKKLKWLSGLSVTTFIAVIIFYFTVVDRAATRIDEAELTGMEKATHEAELNAVEIRVGSLEKSSEKINKVMYGEGLNDGMIQAVVELSGKVDAINTQVGDLKKQGNLILEELRKK